MGFIFNSPATFVGAEGDRATPLMQGGELFTYPVAPYRSSLGLCFSVGEMMLLVRASFPLNVMFSSAKTAIPHVIRRRPGCFSLLRGWFDSHENLDVALSFALLKGLRAMETKGQVRNN